MATNNSPKHDFAPAWLKIPNSENSKPPSTKQGKRFPSGQSSKFKHHSVDDDYYGYSYSPYSYGYNGYGYPEKYGMQYSSQPSLIRPGGQRDTKYQHPHARYGSGQGMNVGYPPYYEIMPTYEYYGNDPYYNYQAQRTSSKRNYNEKDGRRDSKEGKEKDEKKDKDLEKDKPFNDDFPLLNGDGERTSKGNKHLNGTGVWDNPPNSKANGIKPLEDSPETSHSKVLRDVSIYKNLVPNKTSIQQRSNRSNGSYPRDQGLFTGLKSSIPTSSSSSLGFNKEGGSSPITPPMDILNTRLVTQPKTLSDKKSHFLKTLRLEGSEKIEDKKEVQRATVSDQLVNDVNNLGLTEDGSNNVGVSEEGSNLSSSLEAEQRLLREMGWNEADEEEYEITEDDMREFQNLTKQVQKQNGFRNGFVRAIPKVWSPNPIPVYQPNPQELNETLSSSDSDSDIVGN